MRNARYCLLLVAVLALLAAEPSRSQDVGRLERITRIVTTLSSDDMEGRRAFTSGIERAADFIESEFAAIGLDTLDGLGGYRQTFPVYQVLPESQTIMLNGGGVSRENVLFVAYGSEIIWSSPADVRSSKISTREELQSAFRAARLGDREALYLVDSSLADLFGRYREFAGSGTRTLDLGEKANSVFVLTDADRVESLSATVYFRFDELPLTNLVGTIPGRKPYEIVVFSAHYDHLGIIEPVEGDSIANGANDDASGTAAVIELARHFKSAGTPERTLLFVTFTAEELGGYGSQYFSRHIDPDEVVAMFNIEMIGKPAVSGTNTAWITGFDRSDFGRILQSAVRGTDYEFYPDPYPDQNLFYRSDNAALARLGVPAHTISTTPIDVDKDYHRVSDEIDTLDLQHLANTVGAIEAGAETIVSGEETPTRIDPETVD